MLAYPGEEFQGKVVRIGNRVEAESRTMEVRIEADNADARLKPGMFADVEIVTTIWQDTLLIADTALRLVSAGIYAAATDTVGSLHVWRKVKRWLAKPAISHKQVKQMRKVIYNLGSR